MIVYLNGQFLPKENAHISPDDRGFLFADGTYEVVRIYRGKIFRFENHLRRLKRSLSEIRIELDQMENLREISERLIRENTLETSDANLYIQITRGVAPRNHRFPKAGTPPTVYMTAYPAEPPVEKWQIGAKAILLPDIRWTRCDIKSVSLLPNVLANQAAKEQDADEAVFVRNGFITEGTHTNFAAIEDGMLWTHPINNLVLDGITRDVVLEICQEIGIPVREEPIPESRVKKMDECLILGSTTEVMPVVKIDDARIGDGTPGPATRKLQGAFQKLTRA